MPFGDVSGRTYGTLAGMRSAALIATALLLALSACSGGEAPPTVEPTEPTTSRAPVVTLVDTCPEIEAALPKGMYPSAKRWGVYADRLVALRDAGDTETQNALRVLIAPVQSLSLDGFDLDAHQQMLSALGTIADRCKAVGSSALQ